MKKYIAFILIINMCILTSCAKEQKDVPMPVEEKNIEMENPTIITEDNNAVNNTENNVVNNTENNVVNNIEDNAVETTETADNIKEEDYSDLFKDINGCAVIYNVEEENYLVYNETMANNEVSPYSTFKIVGTLMGLNNKVLQNENSTMNYSGTKYPIDAWNENLTLKQAVQTSCVWYFRQVIDAVGEDKVKEELTNLGYGNCDISQWLGSNLNPMEDLNGFWLGSTLKISPKEQVDVLIKIFQNQSIYSEDHINILKNILLYDEVNEYAIYGKTGTSPNNEGWYVGIAQKNDKDYYFAVYLNSDGSERSITGSEARKIAVKLFEHERQ